MEQTILSVQNLEKTYHSNQLDSPVLKGLNLDVKQGEFAAVMGPSGSGKTTLLNILSGFLNADGGKVLLDGQDILHAQQEELTQIRQKKLGYVFQDFMLLDSLTTQENVYLPQVIAGKNQKEMMTDTELLFRQFGIRDIALKYPGQISGGQKQRVAVARALSNHPLLVLADEPTGNLDSRSGEAVMDAFIKAKEEFGATILMVTHDAKAASRTGRVITLKDGEIRSELMKNGSDRSFMEEILHYLGEA